MMSTSIYRTACVALLGAITLAIFSPDVSAITIANAKALPLGSSVTLDDVVISNMFDTVLSPNLRSVHVQDATGGITIFDSQLKINSLFAGLSEGDSISINGPTTGFNGLFELGPGVSNVVPLGSPGVPTPVEIAPLDLVNFSPTAEGLESRLVNLSNVQFTGTVPGQTFAASTDYTVTDGINSGTVRISHDIFTPHPLLGQPIPTSPVDVKGIFGQFDASAPPPTQTASGYQLLIKTVSSGPVPSETFIDREQATDLRVVSYNILWDTIFPDNNPVQADKFERVLTALEPDVLNLQEIGDRFCGSCTPKTAEDVRVLLNNLAPLVGGGSWHVHQGGDNVIASKYPLSMTETDTDPNGQRLQAIALVDLPDAQFEKDLYVLNNHYKCCGGVGSSEDDDRQQQSDAIVNWLRDARTPGGSVDLPPDTPVAVVGDLNLVGGLQPLNTLVDGNIIDESTYGPDSPPDWDGSSLTDARPLHNGTGPADYTWRDDGSPFSPGRLDYIIYSDSEINVGNQFVLNTVEMSAAELAATGLQSFDVTVDSFGTDFDHLPVVVDFREFYFADSDFNFSRSVDDEDLAIWEAGFSSGGTSHAEGDADGDGDVDGFDFLRWQQEHTGPLSSLAAVPEPTTMALLLISGLCAVCFRR